MNELTAQLCEMVWGEMVGDSKATRRDIAAGDIRAGVEDTWINWRNETINLTCRFLLAEIEEAQLLAIREPAIDWLQARRLHADCPRYTSAEVIAWTLASRRVEKLEYWGTVKLDFDGFDDWFEKRKSPQMSLF